MKQLILESLTQQLENFEINEGSEQRTVGDLVEYKVKSIIMGLTGNNLIKECLEPRSKRSIEDVTVVGEDGVFNYVDSKTHNTDSEFSMPNLTSVERLRKLLIDDTKSLIYIFVSYNVSNNIVNIESIEVRYVWELDFSILTIGSLGKGQLQITNMNNEMVFTDEGKEVWLEKLKTKVREYHEKRIQQIEKDKLNWIWQNNNF